MPWRQVRDNRDSFGSRRAKIASTAIMCTQLCFTHTPSEVTRRRGYDSAVAFPPRAHVQNNFLVEWAFSVMPHAEVRCSVKGLNSRAHHHHRDRRE